MEERRGEGKKRKDWLEKRREKVRNWLVFGKKSAILLT